MKKWEQAARSFIDSCSFKDEIDAVFLTGSYASGNADEFSDIDLYIVLSNDAKWRERGNKYVDGFIIEYFANPLRKIMNYIDDSYANASLIEINMILSGVVIYNQNSAAEKVIDYCTQKSMTDFPKMGEFNIKTGLLTLWDSHDELHRAYKKQSLDMTMQFYEFMRSAFELYSRYICSPVPGHHKLYRWLLDENYHQRYGLPTYNDPVFLEMVKHVFKVTGEKAMYDLSHDIYTYVTHKMGGFDIGSYVLHGPCD
ncbi:MAG: nucleotidyltransferase domain-containing protein [Defluviitaleaceae bacterium]|nr:nucleotidyltransferase domain-containing protein [Defluviitaleaceae bacterium]